MSDLSLPPRPIPTLGLGRRATTTVRRLGAIRLQGLGDQLAAVGSSTR